MIERIKDAIEYAEALSICFDDVSKLKTYELIKLKLEEAIVWAEHGANS